MTTGRRRSAGSERAATGAAKRKKAKKKRIFVSRSTTENRKYYEIRHSAIHDRGVFAATDIPAGTRIIEYLGEKITKAESERRATRAWDRSQETGGGAVYLFTLNQRYDIDGAFAWNTARLINHSCDPNCEVDIIRGRIWICALRDIAEGEELTFNYGFDLESFEDHPCFCGTDRCIGYIAGEDYWPALRRRLQRQRDAAKKIKRKKTT